MTMRATGKGLGFRYGRNAFRVTLAVLLVLSVIFIFVGFNRDAWAPPNPMPIPIGQSPSRPGCFNCGCVAAAHASLRGVITMEHIGTRGHITTEFALHRYLFVIDRWFRLYVLNAMMSATQQSTAVAMQQMQIIGAFFDAKQQLEVQRTFQRLKAQAHRDYHPSMDMCVFGTNARSLAAAQRLGETAAHIINQRYLDRQLHNDNTMADTGSGGDGLGRMRLFFMYFCDIRDNNNRLEELCNTPRITAALRNQSSNADIEYHRTIEMQATLQAFFTGPFAGAEGARTLMEMANQLYGHEVPEPKSADILGRLPNRPHHLTARSIAAKRSVAVNSFASIAGMRVSGSVESRTTGNYGRVILRQLGLTDTAEINRFLGDRPSYNAQMEVLTKKIYQRPEFFTNLYDTEANVARKQASMRAIGLMQNFDMFKSRLRNEAMLSVLLELELADEQNKVIDSQRSVATEGRRE
jgi:hypothetical protein